jgi:hypothetical protein
MKSSDAYSEDATQFKVTNNQSLDGHGNNPCGGGLAVQVCNNLNAYFPGTNKEELYESF